MSAHVVALRGRGETVYQLESSGVWEERPVLCDFQPNLDGVWHRYALSEPLPEEVAEGAELAFEWMGMVLNGECVGRDEDPLAGEALVNAIRLSKTKHQKLIGVGHEAYRRARACAGVTSRVMAFRINGVLVASEKVLSPWRDHEAWLERAHRRGIVEAPQ